MLEKSGLVDSHNWRALHKEPPVESRMYRDVNGGTRVEDRNRRVARTDVAGGQRVEGRTSEAAR